VGVTGINPSIDLVLTVGMVILSTTD